MKRRILLRMIVLHYYGETIYFILWLVSVLVVIYDVWINKEVKSLLTLTLAALSGYQAGYRLERAGLNITRKGRVNRVKPRA